MVVVDITMEEDITVEDTMAEGEAAMVEEEEEEVGLDVNCGIMQTPGRDTWIWRSLAR